MSVIEFDAAEISIAGSVVLRDVSFTVGDGEFLGVIGPSGSGKTSLLRAIAGFADVTRGVVRIDGHDTAGMKVGDRDVGMAFQDPVLFGHRSVTRNVSFPLELRRQHADEIRQRVGAETRALHIEHLLDRNPNTLSRGEAQLVQIARVLVRKPKVLLLDEPIATLDHATRRRMRRELTLVQQGYGVTTVMATNDADDAMEMATLLVVLGAGRVMQVATPREVRRAPSTIDAAIATGECWMIPARVERGDGGSWLVRDDGGSTSLRYRAWSPALMDRVGQEVLVGIRPGDCAVDALGPISARVTKVVPGQITRIFCDVAGSPVGVQSSAAVDVDDLITIRIDHAVVFDASTGRSVC